ncbi:MAG: hypothetical protein ACU85U_04775 [Gammaproteobacteria bacterium]|jgi:hypothetical protein
MRAKIMAALIVVTAGAIAADYAGLFGVREERAADYIHVTFQFVDAATRAPVADVHVACTRPMVRSACTETRGPGTGQTTITLGAYRITLRRLLFSEDAGYSLGVDDGMHLTFIPANHARATLTVANDDPILAAGRPHLIELVANAE